MQAQARSNSPPDNNTSRAAIKNGVYRLPINRAFHSYEIVLQLKWHRLRQNSLIGYKKRDTCDPREKPEFGNHSVIYFSGRCLPVKETNIVRCDLRLISSASRRRHLSSARTSSFSQRFYR